MKILKAIMRHSLSGVGSWFFEVTGWLLARVFFNMIRHFDMLKFLGLVVVLSGRFVCFGPVLFVSLIRMITGHIGCLLFF